jgi:hypothetical protein
MQSHPPGFLTYADPALAKPWPWRWIVVLGLSLLPYAAFAASFYLEWIDYFGPGIPFYPVVFILVLFLSVILEGIILMIALTDYLDDRRPAHAEQKFVRWVLVSSGTSMLLAVVARVYLWLDDVI